MREWNHFLAVYLKKLFHGTLSELRRKKSRRKKSLAEYLSSLVTVVGVSPSREEIHLKYDGISTIFMPHFLLIFLRRWRNYGSFTAVYFSEGELLVNDTNETFEARLRGGRGED